MTRLPLLWTEPFQMTNQLGHLMDEFFKGFERDRIAWPWQGLGQTDIYEEDGQLVYETELPGLKRSDIEIKVENGRLIISGETRRNERIADERYFRRGRSYGKFQRVFPLPESASDPKKIRAKFADGVLHISVPLKEPLGQQTVRVKVE